MIFHLFHLLVIQSFLWKQLLDCGLIKSPGLLEHCGASIIKRGVLQCFLAGFLPHPLMQIDTAQFSFKQSNWLTLDENLPCSILTSWKTASNSSLSCLAVSRDSCISTSSIRCKHTIKKKSPPKKIPMKADFRMIILIAKVRNTAEIGIQRPFLHKNDTYSNSRDRKWIGQDFVIGWYWFFFFAFISEIAYTGYHCH